MAPSNPTQITRMWDNGGSIKSAPGGAQTPLIQGPSRTGLEFD